MLMSTHSAIKVRSISGYSNESNFTLKMLRQKKCSRENIICVTELIFGITLLLALLFHVRHILFVVNVGLLDQHIPTH